jgi:ABC-2 type transport system ATP-binding protein
VGASEPNRRSNSQVEAERSPEVGPRLEVRDLRMSIRGRVILDQVSFSVAPGEIVGILGPNGSGKTSLMRCITGLWRPDQGSVRLDGTLLDRRGRTKRADMGVVFQEPSLDIKMTARENLILGAKLFGVRGREAVPIRTDLGLRAGSLETVTGRGTVSQDLLQRHPVHARLA